MAVFCINNHLDILTNVESLIYFQLREENEALWESVPLQIY